MIETTPSPPLMTAFDALVRPHRRALHLHCYRMVGSFAEADDLVQETLLRAWNARDAFDASGGEAGMRRWLYRIATNACLDHLRSSSRQAASARSFAEIPWLQPYPDVLLEEEAVTRESIALGYLAVIQRLPPRQRAAFVLCELLDGSAAETASLLETSVAAVNSSLQRARATLSRHEPPARGDTVSADERALLEAFISAHQSGDCKASIALLTRDVRVTMPPLPACFEGVDQVLPLMERANAMGEWRLVPAWANRMPAAMSYLRRPGDPAFRAFKLDVLHVRDGRIHEITTFEPRLKAAFGLPEVLA
ncbi:sigma-70 family RNA polymerase sigma factor [Myxococcus llanfairpwllgwyngyllgogerychwyrndrobwllllantysiliogogogochensis]|uniref:Sigma-70 family RNA polymerase sigma factor n=1 Tax=Myxococcus llanfairpwllgwyngyllgogerychwyrndrobwllllantysiliogogogochensis TaxID=2590453 RepID=A0A540WV80_9BACT|nr:RNA polymerase subunit sigma-70 [Myxococcus llanfairpwllgwyngyllgogerychwyrndrobwllllantysiliogogogochensis]TQF12912.1 sigma-70 family RNA polymerase sigma factor [Myxococcus llanfairpwllgwyngyllgogerychwyrndrobwllllantysiliogogogochensis]